LERIKGMIEAEDRSKLNLYKYIIEVVYRHGGAW
jgi:hypothetical protein